MILSAAALLACVLGFNLLTYAFFLFEKGRRAGWERRFYQVSWGGLGVYLTESLCTLLLVVLWAADFVTSPVRGRLRAGPKARTRLRPGDRPLILCHGYHMRGWTLGVLAFWLRRWGRSVVTLPTFGPSAAGIRHYAEHLRGHIREVLGRTGADAVDLVGHSLGGLIARACLAEARRSGDSSVRAAHLVTLGTPHQGTGFWVFTWGDCGLDMKPGSPFLRWLGEEPLGVAAAAIYSTADSMVPEESASGWNAPSVRKARVEGAGHVALSMHPRAARRVFEALRE